MIIRIELLGEGGRVTTEAFYNSCVTAHAFVMIFFIVMPVLIGGFGN